MSLSENFASAQKREENAMTRERMENRTEKRRVECEWRDILSSSEHTRHIHKKRNQLSMCKLINSHK